MMAVTMKEIAERAGVTRSAVSAVLNGTTASRVSAAKREAILKVSRELNYRPNFAATALKSQRTGLLGFICGGLQIPFFSELAMAVNEAATKRGYRVMLMVMPWEEELNMKHLDQMLTSMCDGVLLCREIKGEQKALQQRVKASNIPFVMLESELSEVSSVTFDYRLGMEKAFGELLANGHRRIAFAGHSGDIHKWDAYRECCGLNCLEPIEYRFQWSDDYAGVIDCGARIAQNKDSQTALVTTDYSLSIMIQGMDAAGLRIPQDLSVIAVNDTLQSRFFRPPLTSISQNTDVMARYGLEVILDLIENGNSAKVKSVVIPPELVRRESVRPLD
jgi:DNA-binding LacI/PurR family transcriptional regulator